MTIDRCSTAELKRIIRLMPNLEEMYCFESRHRYWLLDHLKACLETLKERGKVLKKLNVNLKLKPGESYRQVIDLHPTRFAKNLTIWCDKQEIDVIPRPLQLRSGKVKRLLNHKHYKVDETVCSASDTVTYASLMDKKNGNKIEIQYEEPSDESDSQLSDSSDDY